MYIVDEVQEVIACVVEEHTDCRQRYLVNAKLSCQFHYWTGAVQAFERCHSHILIRVLLPIPMRRLLIRRIIPPPGSTHQAVSLLRYDIRGSMHTRGRT